MNDDAYYERRQKLYEALWDVGPITAARLANGLAWGVHEVRAKLMSLRSDGYATYDPEAREWDAANGSGSKRRYEEDA